MEKVIPNFEILFKYHTFYDYFLYLAQNWFVDSASDVGGIFNSVFTIFLEYLFNFDEEFWQSCSTVFQNVREVAFMLIPLVIILTIARTMRLAAGASAIGSATIRASVINLVLSIGLAASCGFIAKSIISITGTLGIEMLRMTGLDIIVQDGVITNMNEVAKYIFFLSTYTVGSGFGTAMDTVLIFMRLFIVIILVFSIGFASITTRIGIMFLFMVSTFMFVIAGYEELEWVRDTWMRGFLSLAIMPTVVGIVISMIIRLNMQAIEEGISSVGDAFKILAASMGLSLIIAMIQSMILTQVFDNSISTAKNTVKSAVTFISNAIAFAAAVKTGGVSGVLSMAFGGKSSKNKQGNKGGNEKGGKKDKGAAAVKSGGSDKKGEGETASDSASSREHSEKERDVSKLITAMGNKLKKKYGLTDEEIKDPENEKNKKADKAINNAIRAYKTTAKVFRDRNGGKSLSAAAQEQSNQFSTAYLNDRGGADMVLLRNGMDTALYREMRGSQRTPRHGYAFELKPDRYDVFNNISIINDRAVEWASSDFDDQKLYDSINGNFTVFEDNENRPVSFFSG